MKQGNNFILNVNVGVDLDEVEKIEFIFRQERGERYRKFLYPSSRATKNTSDGSIELHWYSDETYMFDTNDLILMDTKITYKDSDINPDTDIVKLRMKPTLFRPEGDTCDFC